MGVSHAYLSKMMSGIRFSNVILIQFTKLHVQTMQELLV